MPIQNMAQPRAENYHVVLVLQGGGALGAYHIGAYQALEEAGYLPDWVAGISIGAINSAIIVGNPPEQRLEKLATLWHDISRPDEWGKLLPRDLLKWFNMGSATEAFLLGQPNFFFPRFPNPYFALPGTPGATSFYDTTPLRQTLEQLADFDLINSGPVRLSLGATEVTTGELEFFENQSRRKRNIQPEHVIASGSLPPGFPPIQVDGKLYWDGGCVSNTPLQAILDDQPDTPTLVFMIDLWDPHGPEPRTMDEVLWRQKQIQYASRTAHHIETVVKQQNLQRAIGVLKSHVPEKAMSNAAVQQATAHQSDHTMHIVHIIYHPTADQVPQSAAEFSRPSIAARRADGYKDMKNALKQAPWFHPTEAHVGAIVHKFQGEQISREMPIG